LSAGLVSLRTDLVHIVDGAVIGGALDDVHAATV
jgi:anthraniloyl-CoA monooxygenase